jgi:hypothetical protein
MRGKALGALRLGGECGLLSLPIVFGVNVKRVILEDVEILSQLRGMVQEQTAL